MDDTVQKTANDYRIRIEPIAGEVVARRGEAVIADSHRAKVMFETRLAPVLYFPIEDVRSDLFSPSDFRTFCPFRGTATYKNLTIDGETISNAAWCYERALEEGREIEGYLAFMPGAVSDFDLSGPALETPAKGNIAGPVVDWLLREAWLCKTPEELTETFARKLLDDGISVSRISILIWSLHPLIAGKNYVWLRDTGVVETFLPSYDIHTHPDYVNSPLRHVSNGLGGVRQRLTDQESEFSFSIMDDLREQGATDYVAMPLAYSNGRINVLTLTSDHPTGFTTPNLGLVFECATVISRFFEVFTLKENADVLLETYLGKRTGARVLGGDIRRGDGDEIDAAILFCDLRDSSLLEGQLERAEYLDLLNHFFQATTEIVNAHDGEVLKFIGDAVLAIFPAGANRSDACANAATAAKQIVSDLTSQPAPIRDIVLDCAIGLSFGNVTYGNVGSRERLDFTVIGSAANIAARLSEHCKNCGHRILASSDMVLELAGTRELGEVKLHNVSEPVNIYAVGSD